MQRVRLFQLFAGLIYTVIALPLAVASLIRLMDLPELTTTADQIVVADVLSVRSAWDTSHRNIYTTIEIGVRESWKGTVPSHGRIAIRQLGGTVEDIEMTVHGMPRFTEGERAVVFLQRAQVVGMSQGKRRLHWDSANKRWMADPPARTDIVTIERNGRLRMASPSPAESSLDSLREQVRTLVGK
jgi:hypothetical protein